MFDPECTTVRFPVSRFVVDPERYEDDAKEPMAERGQGVIYTRTTDGRPLRNPPTAGERDALFDHYYRPPHAKPTCLVEEALATHGWTPLIDGHSFPSTPRAVDLDQSPDRPDICIGTDRFHKPSQIIDKLKAACDQIRWSVDVDRPYAGTLVPTAHYGNDPRVVSVLIEVNRLLYLEDESRDVLKSSSWGAVWDGVRELVMCAAMAFQ